MRDARYAMCVRESARLHGETVRCSQRQRVVRCCLNRQRPARRSSRTREIKFVGARSRTSGAPSATAGCDRTHEITTE